jgi:PhnB protein
MNNHYPATPNGYHTVTPYLTVAGGDQLIDFMTRVFDAQVSERINRADGKILHADVRLGDATIMLADASDSWPPLPGALYVYVHDTDTTYQQALSAGAISIMQPADQFHGDRMAGVRDPFGNVWWIVTYVERVAPEELQRRADELG